jgi:hypothetical protein
MKENQVRLKLNAAHQVLVCASDVKLLRDNINIMKNTESHVDESKGVEL